jgi:hypothetical protein
MSRRTKHRGLQPRIGMGLAIMLGVNATTALAQYGTSAPGTVEEAPAERPARDLTGVWGRIDPPGVFSSGSTYTAEPPRLTAWGEARFAEARNSNAGGFTLAETNDHVLTKCHPPGVPRVYFHPYPFEFIHTPKYTAMLYEYDHTVRRIYTDGRGHPEPEIRVPLWLGHSIGQWRDDYTFVVDTVGFNDRTWLDRTGIPHSEDLHVVEVFRRVDERSLEIDITMSDPVALAEPWTATLYYRLAPEWELGEISCSGDYLDFASFENFPE